ncbi:hypothetical protein, partial [Bradyrhizobium sp. SYSU BS000235]|uniref:hypothetical protein n=1 Tax=Bradyrhizobium sp. SYSU BS000235 TaxID=3411332 RepID=UPI003C7887E7
MLDTIFTLYARPRGSLLAACLKWGWNYQKRRRSKRDTPLKAVNKQVDRVWQAPPLLCRTSSTIVSPMRYMFGRARGELVTVGLTALARPEKKAARAP